MDLEARRRHRVQNLRPGPQVALCAVRNCTVAARDRSHGAFIWCNAGHLGLPAI